MSNTGDMSLSAITEIPTALPLQSHGWTRGIDPTTVFVGGLEVLEHWDEPKLRHTFARFGTIEDIHLVKPRMCDPVV